MPTLHDLLEDAVPQQQPPPSFDPAEALDRGRARRRRRQAIGTSAFAAVAVGTIAVASGVAFGQHSSNHRSNIAAEPQPSLPPETILDSNTGPACGKYDPRLGQAALRVLPDVGPWGPVSAAPGICHDDNSSFAATVHIGDKVGFFSIWVNFEPSDESCPTPASTQSRSVERSNTKELATDGGAVTGAPFVSPPPGTVFGTPGPAPKNGRAPRFPIPQIVTTPGVTTCSEVPEGRLVVTDGSTMTLPGQPTIQSSSAGLVLKSGKTISAQAQGGPDHSPSSMRPVGLEPYTGSELRDVVLAIAHETESEAPSP